MISTQVNKRMFLNRKQKTTVIIAVFAIFILWGSSFLLLLDKNLHTEFGDMFGAVDSLFSGLAFGGIIFTILLQRDELELQRDELRQTRNEFSQQNATMSLQRFENTFFQMINLQNEILKSLKGFEYSGRELIDKGAKDKISTIVHFAKNINTVDDASRFISDNYYENYYRMYESNLNHYFRNLYHIYKFLYFSPLSDEDKKFYSSLVRAQLSQNQLYIIAFNAVYEDYGYPKFAYLIKEFDILQNFRWQEIRDVFAEYIKHEIKMVVNPFNK